MGKRFRTNKTEEVAMWISEHLFDGAEVTMPKVAESMLHVMRHHISMALHNLWQRGALERDPTRTITGTSGRQSPVYRVLMPKLRSLDMRTGMQEGLTRERRPRANKPKAEQPVEMVPEERVTELEHRVQFLEAILCHHFGQDFFDVVPDEYPAKD